jgi:hypothetical protein
MPNGVPEVCQPIARRCRELEELLRRAEEARDACLEELDPRACRNLIQAVADRNADLRNCEVELNRCIEANTPPTSNLQIAGIELTQAIQFFNFNGRGSGLAPNNSLGLVANKGLILRVYVDRTALPTRPIPTRITGRVSYPGKPELTPINGTITARSGATIDRGDPQHTLNFRVPARDCIGTVPFTATVFDPAHPTEDAFRSPPFTINAAFESVPRLPVHIVSIRYTGLGLDLPAPSYLQSVGALRSITDELFPIASSYATDYEVLERDLDFRGARTCGGSWFLLTSDLWVARLFSFTNDVYLGLLPAGVPRNGSIAGCGGGGCGCYFRRRSGHRGARNRSRLGAFPCPLPASGLTWSTRIP